MLQTNDDGSGGGGDSGYDAVIEPRACVCERQSNIDNTPRPKSAN